MARPRKRELVEDGLEQSHCLAGRLLIVSDDQEVVDEGEDVSVSQLSPPSPPPYASKFRPPAPEQSRHALGDVAEDERREPVAEGQAATPKQLAGSRVPHHEMTPRARMRGHTPEAVSQIVFSEVRAPQLHDTASIPHRRWSSPGQLATCRRAGARQSKGVGWSLGQSPLDQVSGDSLEMTREHRAIALECATSIELAVSPRILSSLLWIKSCAWQPRAKIS
eukprot:7385025-Prymnesium_polylepis.3